VGGAEFGHVEDSTMSLYDHERENDSRAVVGS
jgi:hypothetical protein